MSSVENDSGGGKVEGDVAVPSTSLWVMAADDPSINSKLTSAVVHGRMLLALRTS